MRNKKVTHRPYWWPHKKSLFFIFWQISGDHWNCSCLDQWKILRQVCMLVAFNWSEFCSALKRPQNTDRKPLFLVFIVSTQNCTLFLLFQCVMLLHISWNSNKCRFFKEGSKGIALGPALINKERHLETHRNGEKAARRTLLHSLVQAEESE